MITSTLFKKNFSFCLILIYFLSYSQNNNKTDSLIGEFTYLLTYKPNKINKEIISKEAFKLYITNTRSFYLSDNKMKFDSIFRSQFRINRNIDMRNFPINQSFSNFTIIQDNQSVKFYESIGNVMLYYNNPIIKNWKLINETKEINSFNCKKAEVNFKGRNWVAWYATEIPFPYGPHKFSGLPGLIIKISDKTGDYNFELIHSTSSKKLYQKILNFKTNIYDNAKEVTKKELITAKKNDFENTKQYLKNTGTILSNNIDDNSNKNDKKSLEVEKTHNPLELEE